jgi:hypothetical protein
MQFKFNIFGGIFLLSLVILISGCSKEVVYSDIPAIQFKSANKLQNITGRDSALILTISYTDGDGDLGLNQEDTFPPFNDSAYYNNLIAHYYEFIDNRFTEVTVNDFSTDTIRFNYRFLNLTPNTKNKSIKGDIEFTINYLPTRKSNRIRFKIYIFDRALHKSNEVFSPEDLYFYP